MNAMSSQTAPSSIAAATVVRRVTARAKLAMFLRDIKISHTIFALPWALLSTVLAGHEAAHPLTLLKVVLILICMATARTVAMASNRLLDADLDRLNPRRSQGWNE